MKRVLVFVLSILVAFSFAFARDMDRPGQENLLEKIQQMAPPEREATLHQRGWVQVQLPYVHSYQDLIPAYVRENMPPEMLDKVIQAAMEKEMEQPFADMAKINRWIPSEKDFAKVFREQAQSKFGSGDGHNACNFSSARKGDALLVHNGFTAWGFYAHAGIWYGGTGTYATIESNANESYFGDPNPGVRYEPASHWNDDYDYCRLMRVNTWPLSTSYRAKAADYARDQLGKPYTTLIGSGNGPQANSIALSLYGRGIIEPQSGMQGLTLTPTPQIPGLPRMNFSTPGAPQRLPVAGDLSA
ncbi:MAG: hypothetical protein DRJ08_01705 [Acidobacteria bacterium]|nr:MAG: hypothetical protein DRJ08_01705 [Acidobacteriota bacterium]